MQTIWGRASQARTSCRCPSCSFQHRSVPRRRTTSSIAQNLYSSTTAFAVSFSTAVAGASYLDARSKQKRRAALDNGIVQAQAEARALREDQDARLRALGIDPAAAAKLALDESRKPDSQKKSTARAVLEVNPQSPHPSLHANLSIERKGYNRQPPMDGRSDAMHRNSLSTAKAQDRSCEKDPWNERTYKLYGHRDAFMTEVLLSRLVYQFELLTTHLSERAEGLQHSSPDEAHSEEFQSIEMRLQDLDVMFKQLRETIWHSGWNTEESDERIDHICSNMESADLLRVRYDWGTSQRTEWTANATQEEELLQLFAGTHSATELLSGLNNFLISCTAPPSIHAFNIILIGLCDHGLPCAARLVLEYLRKSPMEGNAVTHEAAIRCSLLDRDERFFVAYYNNMKCQNRLGWHYGLEGNTDQKVFAFKHSKRLHRGFKPKVHSLYHASMTHSGAEAIIRGFLRSKRIRPALDEYNRLREAGGVPTMHLLEAFLRYCLFASDVELGLATWQQIRQISEKPPSSAYYWMLGVLACSPQTGSRSSLSPEEERQRAQKFDMIAAELSRMYGGTNFTLRRHRFMFLGVSRQDLFRMAEKIEDLSAPQWLPGSERTSLPDYLDIQLSLAQAGDKILPKSLGSYVRYQHTLLKEHVSSGLLMHRTSKYEEFFAALSNTDYTAEANLRTVKPTAVADIQVEDAAKPMEAQEALDEPTSNNEWEDIDEQVEPSFLMPPPGRELPPPVPDMLPWPAPLRLLPVRLPRPYAFPSPRAGQSERLAVA